VEQTSGGANDGYDGKDLDDHRALMLSAVAPSMKARRPVSGRHTAGGIRMPSCSKCRDVQWYPYRSPSTMIADSSNGRHAERHRLLTHDDCRPLLPGATKEDVPHGGPA
jgi:hypothetical protein